MALERISRVVGRGVVVPGDDIDTDRIIPARYLKCVTFDGLGDGLFYDERFREGGEPKGHPLDHASHAGASVMVSGSNFGCGSSREHAPQALARAGFRAVIAGSFAEIFFGNATTLGLVCVTADDVALRHIVELVKADPRTELTIDVDALEVRVTDEVFPVQLPASARDALLAGYWDPLGELLEGAEAVRATAQRLGHHARAASAS
jgi:3-isopropylmalate/(R)-2-methylmalate dehydratase small subunit